MAEAFHDLIKWYGLVDEGVVLCKDGSYVAGWYLEGDRHRAVGRRGDRRAHRTPVAGALPSYLPWIGICVRPRNQTDSSAA